MTHILSPSPKKSRNNTFIIDSVVFFIGKFQLFILFKSPYLKYNEQETKQYREIPGQEVIFSKFRIFKRHIDDFHQSFYKLKKWIRHFFKDEQELKIADNRDK